jgi:N-acetylneuraminic acid mutarotase
VPNIDPKRVFDYFSDLSGGMDADTDPSDLDKEQCAFVGNISLRGNAAATRPPYFNKLLGFENSSVQSNFTGRFQGACFYEANDETENSIITSIAGRLFRIYLDAGIVSGTGSWQNTGFLNTPRDEHTTTLLANGKVLVTGGASGSNYAITSCEIYDPATGVWTNTGSMASARVQHTATLLSSGKVLVSGGFNAVGVSLATCELYDPVAGTWAGTGSLATARGAHTSTLLSNGKVLVAGGSTTPPTPISTCEIYDPIAGTWSNTGSIAVAKLGHTATLLPNGNVLVVGGADAGLNPLSSCEIYNSLLGTWANTGSLNTARDEHTATLLSNGQVLVAGGMIAGLVSLTSCELYDPVTATWTFTGSLNTARQGHSAFTLANGKILVVSGAISVAIPLATLTPTTELYDITAGTWSNTGSLTASRLFFTAVLLNNNKVLVTGGLNYNSSFLSSAELFTANIYSTTVTEITPNVAELVTENFVVPTIGQTVTIYVTNELEFTVGQNVIIDSGSYTVSTIGSGLITAVYNGGAANTNWLVVTGEVIYASNGTSQIVAANIPELVTQTVAVPMASQPVTVHVTYAAGSGTPFTLSQNLLIDGGSYTVASLTSNSLVLTYNGGASNTTIAVNKNILGNWINLETTTGFTVPLIGVSVSIPVINNSHFTNGHYILIDLGSYLITSVVANPIVTTYKGGAANGVVASGTHVLSDTNITSSIPEIVTGNFSVPALNEQVTISVESYLGFNVNDVIVIDGDNFTINTLLPTQNQIVATYTGGVSHVLLQTGILDSSGNQIYHVDTNPPNADMVFLYQGENYVFGLCENQGTLIYDGSTARRADQSQQELQSSYVGVYAWGRNWLAQVNGHRFVAGDLVGDPSGTPSLAYVDAILKMTENNLLNGGGAFSTPANLGMITAMSALSQLDSSLGIGPILVGTVNSIFSVQAPVDRTTWQNIRYPIQSVALQGSGPTGPRQMITVNSDAWFRSLDGVRSLMAARRDFKSSQSNTPNSLELSPIFDADDQSLLYYGSLATFDNRIFITTSPYRTSYGIAHRALAVINQDAISSMNKQSPPIWEGLWTGLNILQILSGQINGMNHCYAFVLNVNKGIDLWELLPEGNDQTYDILDQITNGVESLTQTSIEGWIDTRSMNFGDPFQIKKLIMAELYMDSIVDNVTVNVYFKPDQYPLWTLWQTVTICANVSQCTFQGTSGGSCVIWQEQFKQYGARLKLGRPPETPNNITSQPMDRGFEFQFRLETTGSFRVRKFKAHALMEQQEMEGGCSPTVVCKTLSGCQKGLFAYNSYGIVNAIGGEGGDVIGGEGGDIIGSEI